MSRIEQVLKGIAWSAALSSTLAAVILIVAYYRVMSFVS
jgi:hypothetical protein